LPDTALSRAVDGAAFSPGSKATTELPAPTGHVELDNCQTAPVNIIPDSHKDLLERPLYCHLATVSAAGRPQANPMWFIWDGHSLRFTHTNTRRKYRQLQQNPHLAISIVDPDNPARYLEVRATVDSIDDDFTGSLYVELSQRYGRGGQAPPDAATRVAVIATPYHATTMG
jgi:PPOX class probable F420-dependent enzyme